MTPLPVATTPTRTHLCGLSLEETASLLSTWGEPRYRAAQILEWIYKHGATTFDAMTTLSKVLRERLAQEACIERATSVVESVAADGTRKLLLEWHDGSRVETVWIPSEDRHTVCVSSQVGCPVGCRFCASGLDGVERNLEAGEIVEQALRVARLVRAADADARLSNVVLMGMGEPLANYDAVVRAIRIMNAEWGIGIGARHITLSTVGLPKQMRALAREGLPINLALSLHAPSDELRAELIPWARGIALDDLLEACRDYFRETGREITLEYVLLAGINDSPQHAQQLAAIARSLRANVNLLRYNPVAGLTYRRPTSETAHAFQAHLRDCGANSHIRTSRGSDVDAACGQLRRKSAASGAGR